MGETLNAGTGKGISIGDLADLILEVLGVTREIVTDDDRVRPEASEVFELLADAGRLTELTGWTPQVPLREGLQRTAAWVERNIAALKPDVYNV